MRPEKAFHILDRFCLSHFGGISLDLLFEFHELVFLYCLLFSLIIMVFESILKIEVLLIIDFQVIRLG